MRLSVISLGLLALLTPLAAAWSKEDQEIFRLRDEIITHEGPDVTFYSFLDISPSASQDDISKAYRKKSRTLHPDKVKQQLNAEKAKAKKAQSTKGGKPGVTVTKPPTNAEIKAAVKAAGDRQARLGIVANVLKGSGRERYDHFMSNGFPTWKGTGYYYNRYRPGLGTVMVGVFLFAGGGAHYLALYMGYKRQKEFVERYIKFARHAAWGENLGANIPGLDAVGDLTGTPAPPPPPPATEGEMPIPVNRKQRRMQERMQEREQKRESSQEGQKPRGRKGRAPAAAAASAAGSGSGTATPTPSGPTGAKKRVVAENGKVLVVDSRGNVYLEQENEDGETEEFLLDPNEIMPPTIKDTALVRMPIWAFAITVGRVFSKKQDSDDESDFENDDADISDFKEVNAADTDSEPGKHTPSTGSVDDDFELLDKSVEDLGAAKASGSQAQQKQGKSNKRKNKKR